MDLNLSALVRALCPILFVVVFQTSAQHQFVFPMKPGTVRVYDWLDQPTDIREPSFSGTIVQIVLKALPSEGGASAMEDTVRLFSFHSYGGVSTALLYTNERNFVVEKYDNSSWQEVLPLLPFEKDTVIFRHWSRMSGKMDSILSVCTPPRSMDLFGKSTLTYSIGTSVLWGSSMLAGDNALVADSIGVSQSTISYDFGTSTSTLVSAFIDGKEHRVQYVRCHLMPLCNSNVYLYKRRLFNPHRDSLYTVRVSDTLIGNHQYSLLHGFIPPRGWSNLFRESTLGVHSFIDGVDSLVLPWSVAVGTQTGRGVVTEIRDTITPGSILKIATAQQYSEGTYDKISWIDSIGIVSHWQSGEMFFRDTLLYAKVCGREFGTLLGFETSSLDFSPVPELYQNVPNPFSRSTTIGYKTSSMGHVRLEVFDVLGRKIATLVDRREEAGDHLVDLTVTRGEAPGLFPPGMYFYQLRVDGTVQTRKMMMLK